MQLKIKLFGEMKCPKSYRSAVDPYLDLQTYF
jgi:hypothetical protein